MSHHPSRFHFATRLVNRKKKMCVARESVGESLPGNKRCIQSLLYLPMVHLHVEFSVPQESLALPRAAQRQHVASHKYTIHPTGNIRRSHQSPSHKQAILRNLFRQPFSKNLLRTFSDTKDYSFSSRRGRENNLHPSPPPHAQQSTSTRTRLSEPGHAKGQGLLLRARPILVKCRFIP